MVYGQDERAYIIILTGDEDSLVSDNQHRCLKVEPRGGYERFVIFKHSIELGCSPLVQVLVANDDYFGNFAL